MSDDLISVASRKHLAAIDAVSIGRPSESSNGCTLKLSYSAEVPENLKGVKEYSLPREAGLVQLCAKDEKGKTKQNIAMKGVIAVKVKPKDGVHVLTFKPDHSFAMSDLQFLYANRHVPDDGNEVDFEFIPAQRELPL